MIGIIGGLSPYSTILYYKMLAEEHLKRFGSHPELIIWSLPIQRVSGLVRSGNLDGLAEVLANTAVSLEKMGAHYVLIAANTPHIVADRVASRLSRARFVSILEAVWERLRRLSPGSVGLLATSATVRYRLYHDFLGERGVEVVTPPGPMQRVLDGMIENVTRGLIDTRARLKLGPIIMSLLGQGVDAIVLGCTELPLLMGGLRVRVPLVDSVEAHVSMVLRLLDEEAAPAHESGGPGPDRGLQG